MDNLNEIKETLKDMFKAAITNAKDGDEKGEWITINGTHVFIPEGANQEEVVKEFLDKKSKEDKAKWKSYDEVLEHAEKQLELVKSKLKEKNTPEKHEKLIGDKINLEDKIKYYKSQKGKEKSETKKESNTTKDTKKHIDRIEKLIKKYNLEPHEEDELLDELGSFEAKLDEGLEPREEEELREQLFDFEDDIKRHQEMKKSDNSIQNGLSEIIKNCKPETKEDLKVLKGLKDILEDQ